MTIAISNIFGQLTVIRREFRRDLTLPQGGKNNGKYYTWKWRFRCSCGRECVLSERQLGYAINNEKPIACPTCLAKACSICGMRAVRSRLCLTHLKISRQRYVGAMKKAAKQFDQPKLKQCAICNKPWIKCECVKRLREARKAAACPTI